MKHKHHIIPEYIGGTDDPSNIVELTIEQHAEAHKKLWEQHGRWEDRIAWQGLAGIIGHEEAIRQVFSENGKRNSSKQFADGTHNFIVANQKRLTDRTHNFLGPTMNKKMLDNGNHPSQVVWRCPHCGIIGRSSGNAKRWHFDKCKKGATNV